MIAEIFVPSLPTLWPGMLLGYRRQNGYYPFCSPTVRYFYFARNAVWRAVKMLGLDRGEVLVPAYTAVATWMAVSLVGATPIGVDIDPATYNLDATLIEQAVTHRTKAIVAVQMQANIVTEAILNFQLIIDRHAPGVASALLQW